MVRRHTLWLLQQDPVLKDFRRNLSFSLACVPWARLLVRRLRIISPKEIAYIASDQLFYLLSVRVFFYFIKTDISCLFASRHDAAVAASLCPGCGHPGQRRAGVHGWWLWQQDRPPWADPCGVFCTLVSSPCLASRLLFLAWCIFVLLQMIYVRRRFRFLPVQSVRRGILSIWTHANNFT